ncbi:hypothetical protein SEPCBS119000_003744 [Sporothrix epigloea]|uniref:Fungal specific transcription factor n=1 Tax=Sporothrix epigloea TaxID=1892477 RepID=A0ABP0DNC1_9PEZI
MPGLQSSRWALRDSGRSSSVPASSSRAPAAQVASPSVPDAENRPAPFESRPRDLASAAAELARYAKIVRRMKWKLPFLDLAYRQATSGGSAEQAAAVLEAELMFKLDFFEYYMLCERALVHLQGVYGITISRGTTGATSSTSKGPAAYGGKRPNHRYHANVLESLDRKENPLHEILGAGHVRQQLGRAKDLRNRWKDADDGGDEDAVGLVAGKRPAKTPSPPLSSYDLAAILASIHEALDCAFISTRQFVANEASKSSNAAAKKSLESLSDMELDSKALEAEDWEFMVEAMDWEAV